MARVVAPPAGPLAGGRAAVEGLYDGTLSAPRMSLAHGATGGGRRFPFRHRRRRQGFHDHRELLHPKRPLVAVDLSSTPAPIQTELPSPWPLDLSLVPLLPQPQGCGASTFSCMFLRHTSSLHPVRSAPRSALPAPNLHTLGWPAPRFGIGTSTTRAGLIFHSTRKEPLSFPPKMTEVFVEIGKWLRRFRVMSRSFFL
ncbi:hypothetical protein BS78_05G093100 [Paspalum vaginatum]|nr:hypothetical protein BS78_05G093100 [Paspalum vaginatum]